jgi:hypothetical protein
MNKGPELDSCALSDKGVSNKSKTKTWRIFLLLFKVLAIITLLEGILLHDFWQMYLLETSALSSLNCWVQRVVKRLGARHVSPAMAGPCPEA